MEDDFESLCFMFFEAHGFVLEQSPFFPMCLEAQGFLDAHGLAILEACDMQGLQGVAAKTGTPPAARLISPPLASAITTDLALGFLVMVAYSLCWNKILAIKANALVNLDFGVSSLL